MLVDARTLFSAHCCSIFFVDGISAAVRAACIALGPGRDAPRVTLLLYANDLVVPA